MTASFYLHLAFILLSWLLMFAAYSGWGKLTAKLLRISLTPLTAPWLGFVLSLLAASLYQLFLPINHIFSIAFFALGIIIFALKPTLALKPLCTKKSLPVAIFALLIAIIAMQLPYCYDTGLYHLNSVRWLNEHPITPGLGNLHHRLGFNQLFFAHIAALNFHPFLNDFAFHCANSFLFVLFGISLIVSRNSLALLLFSGIFFIPMPIYWLASTSPDVASTVLQLVAFYYIAKTITERPSPIITAGYINIAAIIAATSTVIKLSNAPYSLALGICALSIAKTQRLSFSPFKRTTVFILLLIIIWITRGYITSGYPFFPSKFGKLNLTWTIPESVAESATQKIKCFARIRSYELDSPLLNNYAWFNPWLKNILYDIEGNFEGIASILFTASSLLLLILVLIKSKKSSKPLLLLWFATAASLIFWFLLAPDIRFANGQFIALFITSLLLLKNAFPDLTIPKTAHIFIITAAISCYAILIGFYLDSDLFYLDKIIALPKVGMNEKTTQSGLTVLTPAFNDQSWDSTLPSTPEFDLRLKLRKNSLRSGFTLDR